jgi:prevent-host-death family protein
MTTTLIDVRELPARFTEIVELVRAGGEVIVTANAVPQARLAPLPSASPRTPGLNPGNFRPAADFDEPLLDTKSRVPDLHAGAIATTDFDEPLPDEFWFGTP